MFLAPNSAARSMNRLQRVDVKFAHRLVEIDQADGRPRHGHNGNVFFFASTGNDALFFEEMVIASVKMSTQSNPMRAICWRPVAVSMPAWLKALLMMPSFIILSVVEFFTVISCGETIRCSAALSTAASTRAMVFRLSRAPMAGALPVSKAISNWLMVPAKASGNQLSTGSKCWKSRSPLRA